MNGKIQYLVKWKSEDEEDAYTWEPREHLGGAAELLERFEESKSFQEVTSHQGCTDDLPSDANVEDAPDSEKPKKLAGKVGGAGDWKRVKQILPASGKVQEHHFLVVCKSGLSSSISFLVLFVMGTTNFCFSSSLGAAGREELVSNSRLRKEAPRLLLDFYEARLVIPRSN